MCQQANLAGGPRAGRRVVGGLPGAVAAWTLALWRSCPPLGVREGRGRLKGCGAEARAATGKGRVRERCRRVLAEEAGGTGLGDLLLWCRAFWNFWVSTGVLPLLCLLV